MGLEWPRYEYLYEYSLETRESDEHGIIRPFELSSSSREREQKGEKRSLQEDI